MIISIWRHVHFIYMLTLKSCQLRGLKVFQICKAMLIRFTILKKILFIQPSLTLEERYGKLAEGGSSAPPLGIAQLAAVGRGAGSYAVGILDAAAEKLSLEETLKKISGENPDYIGITAVTPSIYKASLLAEAIKRKSRSTHYHWRATCYSDAGRYSKKIFVL